MADDFVFDKIHELADAVVDIVFIHGLDGDPKKTWTCTGSKEAEGDFWPKWLAADVEQANVYAIGYPAKSIADWGKVHVSLNERAKVCLQAMENAGLGERPICLIGYSLGGLLAKQIVRTGISSGDASWKSIAEHCELVIFLGTPHAGASIASIASLAGGAIASGTLKSLKEGDHALDELNEFYRQHTRERTFTLSFYETHKTKTVHVVDKQSADPGVGGKPPIPVDADHIGIARPSNRQHQTYQSIRRELRRKYGRPPPAPPAPSELVTKHADKIAYQIERRRKSLVKANASASVSSLDVRLMDVDLGSELTFWIAPKLVEEYGPEARTVTQWLDDLLASDTGLIAALVAPGGAGKSNLLLQLAETALTRKLPAFLVDVKAAINSDNLKIFSDPPTPKNEPQRLEAMYHFADTAWAAFRDIADSQQDGALVIIDGLNEHPDVADGLLRTAKDILFRNNRIRFLVASRPMGPPLPEGWNDYVGDHYSVAPLSAKVIRGELSKANVGPVDKSLMELFQSPLLLFLGIELLKRGTTLADASAPAIIHQFLTYCLTQKAANKPRVDDLMRALAAHAFDVYRQSNQLAFNEDEFEKAYLAVFEKEKTPPSADNQRAALRSFSDLAIVNSPATGRPPLMYRHHLLHDYLVALHLAKTETEWNDLGFDAATWTARNSEPLELAVSKLDTDAAAFLRAVYDWSYPALISCIHTLDLREGGVEANTHIPTGLRDQIAALLAIKLTDKFSATRSSAEKNLEQLGGPFAKQALELSKQYSGEDKAYVEALRTKVEEHFPDNAEFGAWRAIYTRKSGAGLKKDLFDRDPIIGWTAANVVRRESGDVDFRQMAEALDTLLHSTNSTIQESRASKPEIRKRDVLRNRVNIRRFIYVLGESPPAHAAEARAALTDAMERLAAFAKELGDPAFFQFAMEDALRGLLQLMATNPNETATISDWMQANISSFSRPLLERIKRSSDIVPAYLEGNTQWASCQQALNSALAQALDKQHARPPSAPLS